MFTIAPGVVHHCSCPGRRARIACNNHGRTLPWGGPDPRDDTMREEFQADLNDVSRLLVTMAEAVRAALRKATSALLTADLKSAESVIERDAEVDAIYRQVEAKVADT